MIEALVQEHPKGSNRFRALESAPVRGFGSMTAAGSGWQPFRFELRLAAEAPLLPLRPMLRIRGATEAILDDIAFIAWDEGVDETPPGRSHAAAAE